MEEPRYLRPENLAKLFNPNFKGLTEDERVMQRLLDDEYRKIGTSLLERVRRYRESHPGATLGDSIQALFKELEDGK